MRSTGGRNNQGRLTSPVHAAAATSGSTGSSTSGATRRTSRPRSRAIEYDPNRTARIALLHYADGEKRYILAPNGLDGRRRGRRRAATADILPGNALPLRAIPLGTTIHNIELKRGQGRPARAARPAPRAQLMAKEGGWRAGALPSGEVREVHIECYATDRPGRQPRARERLDRQGGPQPLAGLAAAQPRRHDEPGRPPDGRRRGQDLRRPPSDARRGASRPRAARRATTSGPTAFIVTPPQGKKG